MVAIQKARKILYDGNIRKIVLEYYKLLPVWTSFQHFDRDKILMFCCFVMLSVNEWKKGLLGHLLHTVIFLVSEQLLGLPDSFSEQQTLTERISS